MKVILITGASSGIGFDAARKLSSQGHKVYAAARRVERLEDLAQYGVVPLHLDVTDDESCKTAVEKILAAEGRIDVLVNNAGYGYFGALETVPMEDARNQLDVNVFGLARLCQLVLPSMRGNKGGRIINIASIAGRMSMIFGSWYCVSKYSVEALSDALRMEVKPFGIKVSIIEPGPIHTNWGSIAAGHLEESTAGTAYESAALKQAALFRRAYESDILPKPGAVTKKICRAVNARRPRVRYRAGFGAGLIIFFHAILPARWWDALNGKIQGAARSGAL